MHNRNIYLESLVSQAVKGDFSPLSEKDYKEVKDQLDDIEQLEAAVAAVEAVNTTLGDFAQFFESLPDTSGQATEMAEMTLKRVLAKIGEEHVTAGTEGIIGSVVSGIGKAVTAVIDFVLMIADKIHTFFREFVGKTGRLKRQIDELKKASSDMSDSREVKDAFAKSTVGKIFGTAPTDEHTPKFILESAGIAVRTLEAIEKANLSDIFLTLNREHVDTYERAFKQGMTETEASKEVKESIEKANAALDKAFDSIAFEEAPKDVVKVLGARDKEARAALLFGHHYIVSGIPAGAWVRYGKIGTYKPEKTSGQPVDMIQAMNKGEVKDSIAHLEDYIKLAMVRGKEADSMKKAMDDLKKIAGKETKDKNSDAVFMNKIINNAIRKNTIKIAQSWMTLRVKSLGALLAPMGALADYTGQSIAAYNE